MKHCIEPTFFHKTFKYNWKTGVAVWKFPVPLRCLGPVTGNPTNPERSKTVLDFSQFGSTTGGPLHLVGWVIEGIMLPKYMRNTISQYKDPYEPINCG